MKKKSSDIWQYFLVVDKDYAKCITCGKNYSRKGRTTTSLKGHLKSMHKEEYQELCKIEGERDTVKLNQGTSVASITPIQQTKWETTTQESPKKPQLWDKAKKIDDLIGEMIALQDLPFNFVEGIGFRRVMKAALPHYKLKGGQFFTDHICDEIYTKVASKIGQMLKHFLKLSVTTDVWFEPSANVSLLKLTAHGINEDFSRKHLVLKCCSLHGRHTGDIICDHFIMMLRDWNILDEQLHCFIRDGRSSMVREIPVANIPDTIYIVHQLQLCVRSALIETHKVKDLIATCYEISDHFHHSQIAQDELIQIQTEQLNQTALCVIQDSDTGWSTTFGMIQRLLKIKDSIYLYSTKHNIPQLSPDEWLHLNKIVAILTPFEEITKDLSDTKTCISSVIPLVHALKHTLQIEQDKSDTNQDIKNIIQELIEDITLRFDDLPSNTLYSLATYLDPRYKLKFFNDIIKDQVQCEFLRLLTLHYLNVARPVAGVDDDTATVAKRSRVDWNQTEDEPCTSFQTLPSTQSVYSNLAEILENSSDDEEERGNDSNLSNSNLMVWTSLINEYNKEKRLQLNEDPLLWWKYNMKYKVFAPIVRAYLSPPPGSVPSEQVLSGTGLMNAPLRNRLEGEKAEKLLFVKYNLPLLNFDYQ